MTEAQIQLALFKNLAYRRKHRWITANAYLYAWESDLISVTKAGLVHEFEIKLTASDYRADFVKKRGRNDPTTRHTWLCGTDCRRPNYFWFVLPETLVSAEEVPAHAGLIYVSKPGRRKFVQLRQARRAPRLHTVKIGQDDRLKLADKQMWHYWSLLDKHTNP